MVCRQWSSQPAESLEEALEAEEALPVEATGPLVGEEEARVVEGAFSLVMAVVEAVVEAIVGVFRTPAVAVSTTPVVDGGRPQRRLARGLGGRCYCWTKTMTQSAC